jgi:serine/threonine-protein kinase
MLKKISHFEVIDKLGEGGMGEVYRARDTKLNRDVALKVIPTSVARDRDRMARFEREAQVLAALNHPNIGQIYGLEDADDDKTLVLELVDGATLEEKLADGPLETQKAFEIAVQIANALEYAHEKGIVHRDLKPSNIKLTRSGAVKVLDFGLAKALENHPTGSVDINHSPTLTAATQAGTILGTAGYMSPEQAAGLEVDRRTDIWSFGVVLWEMLVGKSLFQGHTVSHTLAAVLRDELNWDLLPLDVPTPIKNLLSRCLERDLKRRLQAIGEARIILDDALAGRLIEDQPTLPQGVKGISRGKIVVRGMSLLAALTLGALLMYWITPDADTIPLRKFEIKENNLSVSPWRYPVISPDGTKILFSKDNRLWVKDFRQLEARELPETESAVYPFWAPDSQTLGFVRNDRLWKLRAGETSLICDIPSEMASAGGGFTWVGNGEIYFVTGNSGLYRVSDIGGEPIEVLAPNEPFELDFHYPTVLPNRKGILLVQHRKEAYDTLLVWDGTDRKQIFQLQGSQFASSRYSPTGHIVFERQGSSSGIWAVAFDLDDLEITGEPFLVIADGRFPSVSRDGTLLVFRGTSGSEGQVIILDRSGNLEKVGGPIVSPSDPTFSPSEDRVALTAGNSENDSIDILVHDLNRGTSTRLQQSEESEFRPRWASNGRLLYYSSFAEGNLVGIFRRLADGSDEPELLIDQAIFLDISEDGKTIIFGKYKENSEPATFYMDMEEGLTEIPLHSIGRMMYALSPDGRFLAYSPIEIEDSQVYLTRFPSLEGRWQVSIDTGSNPVWRKDGRAIYFRGEEETLYVVSFTATGGISLGKPEVVLSGSAGNFVLRRGFDVSSDGQSILALQRNENSDRSLTIIQSWYAEFERRRGFGRGVSPGSRP